ncbi:hypothetical protein DEI95_09515 [Curtobacterium sp. MCBD17_008]|nr:hypothetical protein DEI95_09515 [Curtobacterium sp. MCBD17_008]
MTIRPAGSRPTTSSPPGLGGNEQTSASGPVAPHRSSAGPAADASPPHRSSAGPAAGPGGMTTVGARGRPSAGRTARPSTATTAAATSSTVRSSPVDTTAQTVTRMATAEATLRAVRGSMRPSHRT